MFTVIPFKITDVWFFFPQICFCKDYLCYLYLFTYTNVQKDLRVVVVVILW